MTKFDIISPLLKVRIVQMILFTFYQDPLNVNAYWQKSRKYVWKCIQKELDQDRRNKILDWAKSSRDARFNVFTQVDWEWH